MYDSTTQQTHLEQTQNKNSIMPSLNKGRLRIRQQHLDYFHTLDSPPNQMILYLSGDQAITNCTHDQQLEFAARLSHSCNKRVLPVNLFTNSVHPFPHALMNAETIYTGLFYEGFRAENIVLGADSMAGGLAIALMLLLKEKNINCPKAVFLFSPCLDLTLSGESLESRAKLDTVLSKDKLIQWAIHYYGGNDPRNPLISPILGVYNNLPPLQVQVGNHEILLSDSKTFEKKVKDAGGDIQLKIRDGLHHGWYAHFYNVVQAEEAIQEVGFFVNKNLPLKPIKKTYGPEDFR